MGQRSLGIVSHRQYRYTLTGNVRGRPRLLGGGLVMQIEERVETADIFCLMRIPPCPGISAAEWSERERKRLEAAWRPAGFRWRDANWQDQFELAAMAVRA
jgi:hypothetical protein